MEENRVENDNNTWNGLAPKPFEKRRSLAITSIILGALSSLCCMTIGIGIVPALIGTAFGIIAIVSGSRNARRLGIIGLVLSAIGLILNAFVIIWGLLVIDWSSVTWDKLLTAQNVDQSNPEEIVKWFQQFLKTDISMFR